MKKIFYKLINLIFILLLATSVYADAPSCPYPANCLPPSGSAYSGTFQQLYMPSGFSISNPTLTAFSNCYAPPQNIGIIYQSTHTYNATYSAYLTFPGGSPTIPFSAPAIITFTTTRLTPSGTTENYQTEMLQFNIQGGGLPPGFMLRESPTLPSLGSITITPNGLGAYNIESFFDIFTELTIDNGQNWAPPTPLQPGRIALPPCTPPPSGVIPTLSEWGLIIFGFVLLAFSIFYIRRRNMLIS